MRMDAGSSWLESHHHYHYHRQTWHTGTSTQYEKYIFIYTRHYSRLEEELKSVNTHYCNLSTLSHSSSSWEILRRLRLPLKLQSNSFEFSVFPLLLVPYGYVKDSFLFFYRIRHGEDWITLLIIIIAADILRISGACISCFLCHPQHRHRHRVVNKMSMTMTMTTTISILAALRGGTNFNFFLSITSKSYCITLRFVSFPLHSSVCKGSIQKQEKVSGWMI
jgi:hypothetical protein